MAFRPSNNYATGNLRSMYGSEPGDGGQSFASLGSNLAADNQKYSTAAQLAQGWQSAQNDYAAAQTGMMKTAAEGKIGFDMQRVEHQQRNRERLAAKAAAGGGGSGLLGAGMGLLGNVLGGPIGGAVAGGIGKLFG